MPKLSESTAPSARDLLLKLLVPPKRPVLTAGDAIRACSLFDISPNNVRVALNRLLTVGLVEAVGRGSYRIGPKGVALGLEVAAWRELEKRLTPWNGDWIAVASGAQPRSERKAVRSGDRAMLLLGFRELCPGLLLRPDNFVGSVEGVRQRLLALGMNHDIPVFKAQGLNTQHEAKARQLWNSRKLEMAYKETSKRLDVSTAKLPRLSIEDAARETWHLGDQAIRQLVFDPLLPEPLVSEAARVTFTEKLKAYDAMGFRVWQDFLD